MVVLVHHNISPHSRKIRILMAEKKMFFVLREKEPWNLSKDIIKINPYRTLIKQPIIAKTIANPLILLTIGHQPPHRIGTSYGMYRTSSHLCMPR